MCDGCTVLLSEALDLCVRARSMDAIDRTRAQIEASGAPAEWWAENLEARAACHNEMSPHAPMSPRSATLPLWVEDQYQRDLAAWEARARTHLMTHRPIGVEE